MFQTSTSPAGFASTSPPISGPGQRHPPLAFVDLETTGLNPGSDRIVEIGVVTVDGGRVAEWSSFVNPGRRVSGFTRSFTGISDDMLAAAPRFGQIAGELRRRLDGRLLVAHNARFDHGFLKAEFDRVAIPYEPVIHEARGQAPSHSPISGKTQGVFFLGVVCTVMLSRKLYPQFADHNLDALMARHGLAGETRHRALPDARLIWGFWQALQRGFTREALSAAIDALLAQPALPAHLDIGLIDRLPESHGVYVFCGEADRPLQIGRAANLKQHLRNYFRLDRNCARAMRLSHEIRDIKWHSTGGPLGARLLQTAMSKTLFPARRNPAAAACFLRLSPAAPEVAQFVPAGGAWPEGDALFGLYPSERKGRNALRKLADRHRLCHALLGIAETPGTKCRGCSDRAAHCARKHERLQHLARLAAAAVPLKLPCWPYRGPIAIRERRDLHIVDRWHYLGTARSEAEAYALLQTRTGFVDRDIFNVLASALPRLRAGAVARLAPPPAPACE